MTFSAEVRMAIEYLMKQIYGARYGNPATINPAPQWCNFQFFSEILPSEVHKLRRINPKDHPTEGWGWYVSREVQFFVRGKLVAEIWLSGIKFDRRPDCKPLPMWQIVHIRYAERFDHGEATNWQERFFELTHYVSAA